MVIGFLVWSKLRRSELVRPNDKSTTAPVIANSPSAVQRAIMPAIADPVQKLAPHFRIGLLYEGIYACLWGETRPLVDDARSGMHDVSPCLHVLPGAVSSVTGDEDFPTPALRSEMRAACA
jgi:hypothetical protein